MLKKVGLLVGVGVLSVFGFTASAQESVMFVLTNGDHVTGQLLDLGGVGFTVRVDGRERTIPQNDVAIIQFSDTAPNDDAKSRIDQGRQLIVLRNGSAVDGRLQDISGSNPLRLMVDTPSGERTFQSSEVASVHLARAPQSGSAGNSAAAVAREVPAGAIRVNANQRWTNTGIQVRVGDRYSFRTDGEVMFGKSEGQTAGPDGNDQVRNPQFPVPAMPVGGLIGRVGNGAAFPIGSNTQPIRMPATGLLSLGVNDSEVGDNGGFFAVTVSRQ